MLILNLPEEDSSAPMGTNGTPTSWSDWVNNYGGDGVNDNPDFAGNWRLGKYELSVTSPAIDAGTDVTYILNKFSYLPGIDITTDIEGNPRNDGHWDIGAYEFTNGGGSNSPPNQPSNPNPINGATGRPVNLTMTWTCTDPDGDPLTYDVYFGISSNPPIASTNRTSASFTPGQLNNNTTYYWKIVAKDNQGHSTTGPIWNFTTQTAVVNNPPNQPSNPSPVNGATGRPVNLTMTWACTDPDGDPLTYDVYFGISSNPPIASTNRTSASFTPAQLNYNTTYYWKIVAKDNQGHSTSGPVWNFSTQTVVVNNPPNQPSNPNPVNGTTGRPINLTMTWICTDPDGDPLTYDVYFGISSNPPIASTNRTSASFTPAQLNYNTTYYWKIVAKDNQGHSTSGPVWNFSTQTVVVNNPPNQPSNPNPVNGTTGRPINLTMTWICTDPDGDPLTYDVYFGTNSTPPIASTNRTSASFTPAQLNYNTTYYWKIVAKDNQGHSTSGPVWNFTTIYMDIIPPEVTNITVTSARNVTVNFSERLKPANAKNKNNYFISNNVIINSVSLLPDSSSVLIKTSIQQRNREYSITMTNIADKSGNYTDPNPNVVSYFLPRRGPGYMIIIPVNKVIANNFDLNFIPEKTIDGKGMESLDSRWQSSTIMPDTLIFDFGNESSLDSLRISFYEWQSNRIYKYSINCSVDSIKWHSVIKNVWSEENEWTEIEFDSTSARYVELILQESNENNMASIWEIEFYGPDKFYKMNNGIESPSSFMLSQNYPNPFNPSTSFKYSIAKQSKVLIRIYDIIGNEIETLVNEEKAVGTYELIWDASNLPSGVYLYQLTAGDFIQTKKMILMK